MADRCSLVVVFESLSMTSGWPCLLAVDVWSGCSFHTSLTPKSQDLIFRSLRVGKSSISSAHQCLKTASQLNKHVGHFSMPCAIRASLPADNLSPNTIEKPTHISHATFPFASELERTPSTSRQPTIPQRIDYPKWQGTFQGIPHINLHRRCGNSTGLVRRDLGQPCLPRLHHRILPQVSGTCGREIAKGTLLHQL